MQSAKLNITYSVMFSCSSAFNLLKVGYVFVMLGHSSLCSHIGFNQLKPIILPSNTVATAHKKNCSMSSNIINTLLHKLSKNSLNALQAESHFSMTSPICGTTRQGSNQVYYTWWLPLTVPIATSTSSTVPNTPPILGSTANALIGIQVFLHRHNIHCW